MAIDKKKRKRAEALLALGIPIGEIAQELGISRFTLSAWKKQLVVSEQDTAQTIENLKRQLSALSKRKATSATARKIAMITKAIQRAEHIHDKELKSAKPKPTVSLLSDAGSLRERAMREAALYPYQLKFFADESQFRDVLKARQIGFTYVAALDALCAAHDNARNQIFLSASEEQALALMHYVEFWAEKFGVTFTKDSENEKKLPNGAVIKVLAHNFRTAQGFTGDVYMDEFAWYPNPKKIWHAIVPSIGAVKGRLTIMSTPFEENSLFHQIYSDEAKYYMFSRHRIDIYQAIADGLQFDLETMRDLFDADTWASAYECQFIDDESAYFSISLIKSCIKEGSQYYTPAPLSPLIAGYDVGRVRDRSSLGVLDSIGSGRYALCQMDVLAKASFDEQKFHLRGFMRAHVFARLRGDKTGIGMNIMENLTREFKDRAVGVYFTAQQKENMCINLKKMFEDKLIELPNDPLLIADIHAIKRKAGAKGFLYDADRNAHGHADRFWALALAASHAEVVRVKKRGRAWVM